MALISSLPEGWDQHVSLSTRFDGPSEMDVSWKGEPPGPPISGLLHLHMRWDSDAVSLAIVAIACMATNFDQRRDLTFHMHTEYIPTERMWLINLNLLINQSLIVLHGPRSFVMGLIDHVFTMAPLVQ